MTADIISLPASAPTAEPSRAFAFTAVALKKTTALFDDLAATNVTLRDDGCRGLVCRKQRRDWTFGVERKIRGRVWRETLGSYDAQTSVAKVRADAQTIMSAMVNGTHVAKATRDQVQGEGDTLAAMTWAKAVALHAERNPLTRKTTLTSYRYAVQRLPSCVPARISATDDGHIRAAYAALLITHSAATANLTLRSIAALWSSWAEAHPKERRPVGNPVTEFRGDGRRAKKRMTPTPVRTGALRPHERAGWISFALEKMTALGPVGGTYGAMAMLALTGLRAREVLDMSWGEIEDDMIVIPAARMKADAPLRRPVTPRLRAILDHQARWHPGSPVVFPSRIGGKPVGDTRKTLDEVNTTLAVGRSITLHDLRRTFIVAAEMAAVPGVASRLLTAHAVRDVHDRYASAIISELARYAIAIENELLRAVTA